MSQDLRIFVLKRKRVIENDVRLFVLERERTIEASMNANVIVIIGGGCF